MQNGAHRLMGEKISDVIWIGSTLAPLVDRG
jgi:hypothetical protein